VTRYDTGVFADLRETLDAIVANTHLVFVQQPPVLNIGDRGVPGAFAEYRRRLGSFDALDIHERRQEMASRRRFETELKRHFAGSISFTFFETETEFVTENGRIRWWDGRSRVYYLDDDHLSEAGVDRFAERLGMTLASIVESRRAANP
jgi:hypothetical protein